MSSNPLLETPHSPPQYERKSATTSAPIEYVDMENSLGSLEAAGSDVDHRSLTDILQSRVADIDHRNLISLTGSPRDTNKKDSGINIESIDIVSLSSYILKPLKSYILTKKKKFRTGLASDVVKLAKTTTTSKCR